MCVLGLLCAGVEPLVGYDVEVVEPGSMRRYVTGQVGQVFNDNSRLVQVTRNLTPGQRVVVAVS